MSLHNLMAAVVAALLFSASSSAAVAAVVGQVVKVAPGAKVTSHGRTRDVTLNMPISDGDVFNTDLQGYVQMRFNDETRIAVGPNSSLSIDDVLMRSRTRASRFAVSAVKGSFRFISGRSNKDIYRVETPIATMGIRGTIFDFKVYGTRWMDTALLEGRIRKCLDGDRNCARMNAECVIVRGTSSGRFVIPTTQEEFDQRVRSSFLYIRNQAPLLPDFRADLSSCELYRATLPEGFDRDFGRGDNVGPGNKQNDNGLNQGPITPDTSDTPNAPDDPGSSQTPDAPDVPTGPDEPQDNDQPIPPGNGAGNGNGTPPPGNGSGTPPGNGSGTPPGNGNGSNGGGGQPPTNGAGNGSGGGGEPPANGNGGSGGGRSGTGDGTNPGGVVRDGGGEDNPGSDNASSGGSNASSGGSNASSGGNNASSGGNNASSGGA